ncbi:MAG: PRC-barrel domain-containing protein [Patescibacteria group bacterium]
MFRFSPKSRLMARTKSGTMLGTVVAIEVDPSTGRIVNFLVTSNRVLSVLSDNSFVIAWNQVVDWLEDEIIVADAFVRGSAAVNIAVAASGTPRSFANDVAAPSVQMSERQ